jgi:hypothetical protein
MEGGREEEYQGGNKVKKMKEEDDGRKEGQEISDGRLYGMHEGRK